MFKANFLYMNLCLRRSLRKIIEENHVGKVMKKIMWKSIEENLE